MLTLRGELSKRTIAKLGEGPGRAATSQEDAWRRRTEMLFERLAVRWVIAGLPLGRPAGCCSAATGWPTPTRRRGCAARSPRTWSSTSPSSPDERAGGAHGSLGRGVRGADRGPLRARARSAGGRVLAFHGVYTSAEGSARWSRRCCPHGVEGRAARRAPRRATRPICWRRCAATGTARVLLLGHLDTVVAHQDHRPLGETTPQRLIGSGAVDMKGGIVLALGVMR